MIGLILTLAVVGLCLYLLKRFVPMDPTVSTIITAVVVICVILWLLSLFGVGDIPIPRLRGVR